MYCNMNKKTKTIYRVLFHNQGQVYEVYAQNIYQSELQGFIEIESYLFGQNSNVVVDPNEEKLQSEFANVDRSFVPIHYIIRIDEVDKEGTPKINVTEGGTVTPFPIFTAPPSNNS